MTPQPNFDNLAERLRERITEPRDDYEHGYCQSCEVALTQADTDAQRCSNCGTRIGDLIDESDPDFDGPDGYDLAVDWYK